MPKYQTINDYSKKRLNNDLAKLYSAIEKLIESINNHDKELVEKKNKLKDLVNQHAELTNLARNLS